jgi:hypothetical protein
VRHPHPTHLHSHKHTHALTFLHTHTETETETHCCGHPLLITLPLCSCMRMCVWVAETRPLALATRACRMRREAAGPHGLIFSGWHVVLVPLVEVNADKLAGYHRLLLAGGASVVVAHRANSVPQVRIRWFRQASAPGCTCTHRQREGGRRLHTSPCTHTNTNKTSRPVHVWADPKAAHAQAMLERVTHIFGCAPSAAAPLRWPAWLADLPIAAPFLDPDYIFSILTGAREDDARAAHLLARTVAAGPHAPAGRLRLPR